MLAPTSHARSCPMCGAAGGRTLRSVGDWDIISCGSCRFAYTPRVLDSSATEVDLPPDYVPVWRARHRQIYRLLDGLLPEGDLIVDVGAGFAELGRVVQRAARHRYIGFEPSQSVARHAQRLGIALRAEIFHAQSLGDDAAGAVVLDNVLEHIEDPRALIASCVAALRPGGILAVIVPNRYDIRRARPGWAARNHWIPPEHVNYFTFGSLAAGMRSVGLECIRPFGFAALGRADIRYWPRALLELVGVYAFGLNVFGRKPL